MTRIFISGPISGMPDYKSKFLTAQHQLENAGFEVHNPADDVPQGEATWLAYMRMSIRALMLCDGLAYLDGWLYSRGAQVEIHLAHDLKLPVNSVGDWCHVVEIDHG